MSPRVKDKAAFHMIHDRCKNLLLSYAYENE